MPQSRDVILLSGNDLAVTSITPCVRGTVGREQVYADLAELAAGRKLGRLSADQLVIFDSSGSGVQDVAAAWAAYREASRGGIGLRFDLTGTPVG